MRRTLALASARSAAALSRTLRRGGGTALPGLIAERIDPDIVAGLSRDLGQGSVLITGTNGKTTTARMVRSIAAAAGLDPVGNREGSNMMRGVAAALVEATDWRGRIQVRENRIGVFEVDEATLPHVAEAVQPRAILFTNLFRDQLDRYGEVDTVAALWRRAVAHLPGETVLVLNADDPSVASLIPHADGRVMLFGVDLPGGAQDELEHAADARWCSECGAELAYSAVLYAHLGHWRCPACSNGRRAPEVVCDRAEMQDGGTAIGIRSPGGRFDVAIPLNGLFNVYNATAAAAAGVTLGLPPDPIASGLASSTAAFGRQERIRVGGREVQMALAKNPAGLNQVLRVITAGEGAVDILFFLNDGIADGRDISWIWDVDLEVLKGRVRTLTVSGTRAWDMALRLKYAGVQDNPRVEHDAELALKIALAGVADGGVLHVIPTYTAMLEARSILGRWSGRGDFWQGDDR